MRRSVLVAILACVLWTAPAIATEQTDFDRGRNAYLARQYEEADARFTQMLDPKTGSVKDPLLVSQARMYWGAAKVALGKTDEALRIFEQLITTDPQFEPDPLNFPTQVLNTFSDARGRVRERLREQAREAARREAERKAREEAERRREAERIARLQDLASQETVRIPRNRFVAFIPFGAGQFQNGNKTLGWTFLGIEAAAVAVGVAIVPFYYAERQAQEDVNRPDIRADATAASNAHRENAIRLKIVNLSAFGFAAVTGIIGIVQANLAYVPETDMIRRRPLPPDVNGKPPEAPAPENGKRTATSSLRVLPSIAPLPSGFAAGVEGRF